MEAIPPDYKQLRRYEIPRCARALNFACFHNQRFLASGRACGWLAEATARALMKHECDLWAYCFMPSHAHLLVLPLGERPSMAALLESLKKSVAKRAVAWVRANAPAFLARMRDEQPNGMVAHRFWQRGAGYDRNLFSERTIWNMIDYIHRNPVEDGLCERPSDWRWSSAAYFESRARGPLTLTLDKLPGDPR